jgi:mRNA interferase MazF
MSLDIENIKFDEWNTQKKFLNQKETVDDFYINKREIWFTKMGKNVGFEEDGKKDFSRPVLVIKKVGNLFFTVALTTKGKEDNHFYHKFKEVSFNIEHKDKENKSFAILSQAKVMDKKRFQEKIGTINKKEFDEVKQKITALLL